MAESTTLVTLRTKRDDIAAAIALYEGKIIKAREDLEHVNATIALFEASRERETLATYCDVKRLFKHGEALSLCKSALSFGPKTSQQLALHVMAAKNLDTGDITLLKSMVGQLVQVLTNAHHRGVIDGSDKHKGIRIWCLPGSPASSV